MEREKLLEAPRWMAQETDLPCQGCGHENNCLPQGCAIIREAMITIGSLTGENSALRKLLEEKHSIHVTPRQAIRVLRNANLAGVLRAAADMGIEALEREMGGNDGTAN